MIYIRDVSLVVFNVLDYHSLRDKGSGDPSRGRAYSPRMEHAIDYKSVLDCGIHQDWTPDS